MTDDHYDETLLRRFLVGDVTPEEQERIEDAFMFDTALHDRLEALEREMMGDYLRGALDTALRERATRAFNATPERRRRLDEERQLLDALESRRPAAAEARRHTRKRLSAPRIVMLLSAAAVALLAVGLFRRGIVRPPEPVSPSRSGIEHAPVDLVFELKPVVRSGTETGNIIAVPTGTDTVTLRFSMPLDAAEQPAFSIRPDGRPPLTVPQNPVIDRADSGAAAVRWTVPASLLPAGDYLLVATSGPGGQQVRLTRPFTVRP